MSVATISTFSFTLVFFKCVNESTAVIGLDNWLYKRLYIETDIIQIYKFKKSIFSKGNTIPEKREYSFSIIFLLIC